MSLTSTIVDPVLRLHGTAAYTLVATLVFGEAAAFVGFVLPGETAVILGGVLAFRHSVSLAVMVCVVVLAAILGDTVGYEVGHRYGHRLLSLGMFDRYREALDRGRERLRTSGGRAVFLARFTAFLRAVMPGLAGTVRMPYGRFLAWNAAGGMVWGTGFTLLGYLAGAGYKNLETYAAWVSEAILGALVVAVIAVYVRRRLIGRRRPPDQPAEVPPLGVGTPPG